MANRRWNVTQIVVPQFQFQIYTAVLSTTVGRKEVGPWSPCPVHCPLACLHPHLGSEGEEKEFPAPPPVNIACEVPGRGHEAAA